MDDCADRFDESLMAHYGLLVIGIDQHVIPGNLEKHTTCHKT